MLEALAHGMPKAFGMGARVFDGGASLDASLLGVVVDSAPDAILVAEEEGRIVLANRAAEDLFLCTRELLVGRPVEELMPERFRDAHRAHRRHFLQSPTLRPMGGSGRLPALRADGTEVITEAALSSTRIGERQLAIVILRDVTARVEEEERLRYLSTHDALTELYNRAFFEAEKERLTHGRVAPISIIALDVDDLKTVNDRFGHAAGDQHLRQLAAVLRHSFRAEDVVARLGGDEFVVLLPGLDVEATQAVAERFLADLARHNEIAARPVRVSIGIATARRADAISAALRMADERMYQAKRGNRRISGGALA
jgi:diguanylate cyclase (GGDEF)-like protein/PAS domain S-box-containing protein